MNVNFYATLRGVVGQKTVKFDLPEGATVQHLLAEMIHRYPALRNELLNENGDLYAHVHIFVNGRDAPFLENSMHTILKDQDLIGVFPAVGGG